MVAVADTAPAGRGQSVGLLPGQDVLTVPSMQHKLAAQLRGLGCGSLPLPLVQGHLQTGALLRKRTTLPARVYRIGYAWRSAESPGPGPALQWWLERLANPASASALLHHAAGG